LTSVIDPKEIALGSARFVYDAGLLSECRLELFAPAYFRGVSEIQGYALGRGDAQFFHYDGLNLVLRHFRRGGFVRHFNEDRYLGVSKDASRSFREWRLLADLWLRGLPVPRPVAASFSRRSLLYRAALVMVQLENTRPLSRLLRDGDCSHDICSGIGMVLRNFHDAQVYHADLNAHNILIDLQGRPYLIDFDRGGFRRGDHWKQGNLRRLERSLHKVALTLEGPCDVEGCLTRILKGYHRNQ
jgi:3-deoxy-D-manno-octulosonic acid kinase